MSLGYDLVQRLEAWNGLRIKMAKAVPPEFSRDEWGYLIGFVGGDRLSSMISESFFGGGKPNAVSMFRPHGPISIWLPNNVSLLGPLVVVIASFGGVPMWVKSGSNSSEITRAFIDFVLSNLPECELREFLCKHVKIERFDRHDERNAQMASIAGVRIIFGSDEATTAVHNLPHPVNSRGISFSNHRSEAWFERGLLGDDAVRTLIKVFSIYGQAGCTSPRRVVVLGGRAQDCVELRDRMLNLWPRATRRDPAMHVASTNILHQQLNTVSGWDCRLANRNGAVIGVGSLDMGEMTGPMSLGIVPGEVEESLAMLPRNIQTIGHHVRDPVSLFETIGKTPVKRFVPISQMHDFGVVWDGRNFLRELFEEVTLGV